MTETPQRTNDTAVLSERRGNVLVLTINRPEARNAVNQAVWDQMGAALEEAERDSDIRAVIITGGGGEAFCAGADLKAIMKGELRGPANLREEGWGFGGFASHPISVPVIAAVNGAALGGGFELVLSCDLVVSAEHATFGLPEVRRGLIAGGGGAFRLPRVLPRAIALELIFTGEAITAQRAADLGLVNAVVNNDDLLPTALDLAERIARNAPLAVQASKRLAAGILGGRITSEEQAWLASADETRRVMRSEDAREGPRAFAEKREPVWGGR